jgi:hypothetical protein
MANSGAPGGNKQGPIKKPWLKCGEVGTYAELNKKKAQEKPDPPRFERDHVPSQAAMLKGAKKYMRGLTPAEATCVENGLTNQALAIAIPYGKHRKHSRTCGSKNTDKKIKDDSKDLNKAAEKDLRKMQKALKGTKCAKEYAKAAKEVRTQDHEALMKKVVEKCTS